MLTKVTDMEVVGEAGDAREGLELAESLSPDVIVLDIRLPDLNGIEVAARLRDAGNTAKIVALSAFSDKRFVHEMLRSGASGYVTKSAAGTELVRAIRAVASGQGYFSPEIAGTLVADVHERAAASPTQPLARREREVLRLIAEGGRSAGNCRSTVHHAGDRRGSPAQYHAQARSADRRGTDEIRHTRGNRVSLEPRRAALPDSGSLYSGKRVYLALHQAGTLSRIANLRANRSNALPLMAAGAFVPVHTA